ncbi:MAG: hypothetical protein E7Z69_03640 [Thermoplasmata archaeon]|nr:hypothetical protein [Thermoplasmata archaeon]
MTETVPSPVSKVGIGNLLNAWDRYIPLIPDLLPGTSPTDAMHLRRQAFLSSLNDGLPSANSSGATSGKVPLFTTSTDSASLSISSMVPPAS